MLWELRKRNAPLVSAKAQEWLTNWLHNIANRAALLDGDVFIGKREFKNRNYLGSGGIGLFRDTLWAALGAKLNLRRAKPERIAQVAGGIRSKVFRALGL
jgi:hypothetical protein